MTHANVEHELPPAAEAIVRANAARLHEIGGEMKLEQVPLPEPRSTDVVVQVKACNVVPNLKNVLATYAEWFPYLPLPDLPAIFGLDTAGVVTQVGEHVTDVKVGARVYVNPGLSCGLVRDGLVRRKIQGR